MKFSIDRIILWPKRADLKPREIKFNTDKVNIITGASRTGKSAIIPIIDYCLGSSKCTIPVDTIRNACEWFGVIFNLEDGQILLCRQEPGNHGSTDKMFFLREKNIKTPEKIEPNTTASEIKNLLNELFSISFLEVDSDGNNFGARVSYRDFMAFLFQPQNVVANADVMFYKTDTMEHRTRLIKIFPYVLGAVTPEVLAAQQELDRINKQKERLQRELEQVKTVSESWKQETISWIVRAKELGLTDITPDDNMPFHLQVECLKEIAQKTDIDSSLTADRIRGMSSEIITLRKEEQEASSQLFALQKRQTEMRQLTESMGQYQNALQIQVQRLEISSWLKSLYAEEGICPLCNRGHEGAYEELDQLCKAIETIEESASGMGKVPAAFDREMQDISSETEEVLERLNAIRKRIREESRKAEASAQGKYTFSEIARFLGRLDANLQTYDRLGKDNELEGKIIELENRISELSQIVDESKIKSKITSAVKYINQKTSEIIQHLDAEHPDDPVEFLIKDLTVKVKNKSGRDDYLWEIGSASNWLAYHVALILAFQQFFQTRGQIAIPNFIVFDQPSQVYFPHQKSATKPDEGISISDEDKEAVKKIFNAMSKYLQTTNNSVQIIVTEHADEDIWGEIPSINLVERWRGSTQKLIPVEWINS